jgi:hypothetical protein
VSKDRSRRVSGYNQKERLDGIDPLDAAGRWLSTREEKQLVQTEGPSAAAGGRTQRDCTPKKKRCKGRRVGARRRTQPDGSGGSLVAAACKHKHGNEEFDPSTLPDAELIARAGRCRSCGELTWILLRPHSSSDESTP